MTVTRVTDETAAVRAANGGLYGLGASVWTRSGERAARVAQLRAGGVWHNDHAYSYASAQATWGGRGESGFGRTHAKHGLYDLTSPKFVDHDAGRVPVPWWFPYDDEATLAFRGLAGVLYGSHKLRRRGVERRRAARAREEVSPMSELSHVDESGSVKMVDVGGKPSQRRRAVARAVVRMAPETAARLRDLPKGDALATAQLAGIMAAKRTAELIPLCHPLPLSHVAVDVTVRRGGVEIIASAETTAQTGVEMEALTAASVAALTIYDMAKAIDKAMTFAVELVEKVKE